MDYQVFAFCIFLFIISPISYAADSDHFVNIALNKACSTSSAYNHDVVNHPANAAVNGNTAGEHEESGNCIHTGFGSPEWWEVNLTHPYPVNRIIIWSRAKFERRMKDCVILVDGVECYRFVKEPPRRIDVNCTSGVINGTVVKVLKRSPTEGNDSTINICEFEVWSCSDAYWSSACDKRCGHCNGSEVCDKVTGHCPSCAKGWVPPFCVEECLSGSFGFHCLQNCSNGCVSVCDKITGYCTCKRGFTGLVCDTAEILTEDQIIVAVVGVVAAASIIVNIIVIVRWWRLRSTSAKEDRNKTDASSGTSDDTSAMSNTAGTTETPLSTISLDDEESVVNRDSAPSSPYENTYDKLQSYENNATSHMYSSLRKQEQD